MVVRTCEQNYVIQLVTNRWLNIGAVFFSFQTSNKTFCINKYLTNFQFDTFKSSWNNFSQKNTKIEARACGQFISRKTVTLPWSTIIVGGKTLLQPFAGLRHSQIENPGRTVRQSVPDWIRSPRIIRPRRCINSSSSRISRVSNVPLDRHGGIRRPAIRSRWHREIRSSPCLVIEIHPTWLIELPIFRG